MSSLAELWDKKERNEKAHDKIMAEIEKKVKSIDKKDKKGKKDAGPTGDSVAPAMEEAQLDGGSGVEGTVHNEVAGKGTSAKKDA